MTITKIPKILAPVRSIDDIVLISKTVCKSVCVSAFDFIEKENQSKLKEFVKKVREYNFELFINFRTFSQEGELQKTVKFLDFLTQIDIDGILINSIDMLQLLKDLKLPFKIIADSGLDIHNISGIEFVELFHKIDYFNITEEVYLTNLLKIKRHVKSKLLIDADNLPWIAEEILKNKLIETILIKGDFSENIIDGINLIQNILEAPKKHKKQKLPFKKQQGTFYRTNHFSGEFLSSHGKDFKFSGNIKPFNWNFKRYILSNKYIDGEMPRLNLRLTSLNQLKTLIKYLKNLAYNPVYSVEYGEIINTADLSKYSFNKILDNVKKECLEYGIKLQLSTPRIIIERDFDRVYEYVKELCLH